MRGSGGSEPEGEALLGTETGRESIQKRRSPSFSGMGFVFVGSLAVTYFRTGIRTIIGAEAFHSPVRDGKEWVHLAMAAKQSFEFGWRCLTNREKYQGFDECLRTSTCGFAGALPLHTSSPLASDSESAFTALPRMAIGSSLTGN